MNFTVTGSKVPFFEILSKETNIISENAFLTEKKIKNFYEKAEEKYETLSKDIKHRKPEELFISGEAFLENLKNELYHKLSKMNKEELIEYFKSLYPEENLNFEKQINDKTYKVNTYFNEESEYTILQIIFEILRK